MVEISNDVVSKMKSRLSSLTREWESKGCKGICYGGILDIETGDDGDIVGHTACHSWVSLAFRSIGRDRNNYADSYSRFGKDSKNFVVADCHSLLGISCSEESWKSVVLWFARESMFSQYVINRDDTDSLMNDGVLLLCGPNGMTLTEAMWSCKVLRYSTEGGKSLDTWSALYAGGVNPYVALLVSSRISPVSGASFGASQVTSHLDVFYSGADENSVKNMLNGVFNKKANGTYSAFGLTVKDTVSAKFRGFCRPIKISDGWGGEVDGSAASKEAFIQNVLDWEQSLK